MTTCFSISFIVLLLLVAARVTAQETVPPPSQPSTAASPAVTAPAAVPAAAAPCASCVAGSRAIMRHLDSTAARMLPQVRSALARIRTPARRLLAVKYYLNRSDSIISDRWAWDAEATARFKRSAAHGIARAELRALQRSFAERNPGYELRVRMEIRTLGDQIGKWNGVASVGEAARELEDSCRVLAADTTAPLDSIPTEASLARFMAFLRAFEPHRIPTVAVPGLSQHGQLRAFDFKVTRRGRLVAGGSSAAIEREWDGPGWTARLCEAIGGASDRFSGPLNDPYEPWHYSFDLPDVSSSFDNFPSQ